MPQEIGTDRLKIASGILVKKQAKANFPYSDVTDFYYSSENQLVGFKVYEGGNPNPTKEVVYTYDALGRRVAKNVIDHATLTDPKKTFNRRYVYDGQNIALEYTLDSGANKLLARYTHSPLAPDDVLAADITADGVTAQLAQNAGTAVFIKDAQGTVTDVTDSAGAKIMHYVYSAFGELIGIKDAYGADVTSAPPIATSFTYTGREHDSESGFYYYRARYYIAEIGRFAQADVVPGKLPAPVTMNNAYAYAGNNSINRLDPSGKSFWSALEGIGRIVVGIVMFIPTVMFSLLIGVVDPGFGLSVFALFTTFTFEKGIANIQGKRGPYLDDVGGFSIIRDSEWWSGGRGFTPGPVSFVPPGATAQKIYHEIGHQKQWQNSPSWGYGSHVFDAGDPYSEFECEASYLGSQEGKMNAYDYGRSHEAYCHSIGY